MMMSGMIGMVNWRGNNTVVTLTRICVTSTICMQMVRIVVGGGIITSMHMMVMRNIVVSHRSVRKAMIRVMSRCITVHSRRSTIVTVVRMTCLMGYMSSTQSSCYTCTTYGAIWWWLFINIGLSSSRNIMWSIWRWRSGRLYWSFIYSNSWSFLFGWNIPTDWSCIGRLGCRCTGHLRLSRPIWLLIVVRIA